MVNVVGHCWIYDEGNPKLWLPGVTVTFQNVDTGDVYQDVTEQIGLTVIYKIEMPAATYECVAKLEPFLTSDVKVVTVTDVAHTFEVDFQMVLLRELPEEAAGIIGFVTNAAGNPLIGALAEVSNTVSKSRMTVPEGAFGFSLEPGTYNLKISLDGYVSTETEFTLTVEEPILLLYVALTTTVAMVSAVAFSSLAAAAASYSLWGTPGLVLGLAAGAGIVYWKVKKQ